MEQHLGRYLEKEEQVHHINEIRDDDRIENLQIMSLSDHNKLHRKIEKMNKKGSHFIAKFIKEEK
jgi:hypothetical protein